MKQLNTIWDSVCKYDLDWGIVFLAFIFLFLVRCLWNLQRDESRPHFDLTQLVMEIGPDGQSRLSKIGFAWMCTLIMTTWVIIRLTLNGKLTEGYFQAYLLAWVTPLVAYVIWGRKPPAPPQPPVTPP